MLERTEGTGNIISWRTLMIVIVGSIATSFLLVPSPEQLRESLLKDRFGGDVMSLIESGAFGDKVEARAMFRRLTAEQLSLISQVSRLTPRERLKHLFRQGRVITYDAFIHYIVINTIQYVDVVKPDDAFAIISPAAENIPDKFRLPIFRLLARNALATGKPDLAANILRRSCSDGSADWQTISSLVDVERWTNHPAEARAELQAWLDKHKNDLDYEGRRNADNLLFSLALESNAPDAALRYCMDELKQTAPGEPIKPDLLERTFTAGLHSGKSREVLPWIERHLLSFPEDKLTWEQLFENHKQKTKPNPDYLLWTQRASQVADWNTVSDRAGYHHLRLIVMGHLDSLNRYMPLSVYLGLGEQTEKLLTALGPVPGHEELQLTLARLTASNGSPSGSLKIYEQWLEAHPNDPAARWEHACLKEILVSPDEAIKTFKKLLSDFPTDDRATKRAVSLFNRSGHHRESLAHFDQMEPAAFDPDSVEDYCILAGSLDSLESLMRALRIKISHSKTPLVSDYVQLAEVARSGEDTDTALSFLREGLTALPNEAILHTEIAAILLQEERFDESVTAAMHPVAWQNDDAKLTALSASIRTENRAEEVLAELSADFYSQTLALNTLLDLAVAHRQAGMGKRADEFFAQVPEIPSRYYRIAEARLLARDYEEAVRLANLNIAEHMPAQAGDWVLLGDIRFKQGRVEDAQKAYARAIQTISSRMRRNTTAAASGTP